MLEKVLAAAGLLFCLVIGLRMLLGAERTRRIDQALAARAQAWRLALQGLPKRRQTRDAARREAAAAIERARRSKPRRDGNVIRPRFGDKKDD